MAGGTTDALGSGEILPQTTEFGLSAGASRPATRESSGGAGRRGLSGGSCRLSQQRPHQGEPGSAHPVQNAAREDWTPGRGWGWEAEAEEGETDADQVAQGGTWEAQAGGSHGGQGGVGAQLSPGDPQLLRGDR